MQALDFEGGCWIIVVVFFHLSNHDHPDQNCKCNVRGGVSTKEMNKIVRAQRSVDMGSWRERGLGKAEMDTWRLQSAPVNSSPFLLVFWWSPLPSSAPSLFQSESGVYVAVLLLDPILSHSLTVFPKTPGKYRKGEISLPINPVPKRK